MNLDDTVLDTTDVADDITISSFEFSGGEANGGIETCDIAVTLSCPGFTGNNSSSRQPALCRKEK